MKSHQWSPVWCHLVVTPLFGLLHATTNTCSCMYLLREVSSARCLFVTALLSLAIVDHEACCYCTVDGTVKNWIGKCSQIGRNFSLHTSHCQGDGLRWMEATFGLLSPEGLLQNFTVASCGPVGSLISTMFRSKELIWCAVSCLHELCHVHICRSSGLVHSKACNPRRSWEEEVNLAQDSVEVNCGGHFMTFYPKRSSPKRSQGIVQGYLLTSCTAYSDILESADCAAY